MGLLRFGCLKIYGENLQKKYLKVLVKKFSVKGLRQTHENPENLAKSRNHSKILHYYKTAKN
jgi:hypothetical protein